MSLRDMFNNQTDPFNAGEPDLSWNDSSTSSSKIMRGGRRSSKRRVHTSDSPFGNTAPTDDECAFDDKPYKAPSKQREHYNAPSPHETREADAADNTASVPTDFSGLAKIFFDSAASDGETADSKTSEADAPKRKKSFLRVVLSNFVILIVVLGFVHGAISEISPDTGKAIESLIHETIGQLFYADEDLSQDSEDLEDLPAGVFDKEQEMLARDAVTNQLDQYYSENGVAHDNLVTYLNNSLENWTGKTAEDLGIDANEFASWTLAQVVYETNTTFVYDNGTAKVYVNGSSNQVWQTKNKIIEVINEYADSHNLDLRTAKSLDAADKEAIAALFTQALSESTSNSSTSYCGFNLHLKDGSWVVDDETKFSKEAERILNVF